MRSATSRAPRHAIGRVPLATLRPHLRTVLCLRVRRARDRPDVERERAEATDEERLVRTALPLRAPCSRDRPDVERERAKLPTRSDSCERRPFAARAMRSASCRSHLIGGASFAIVASRSNLCPTFDS